MAIPIDILREVKDDACPVGLPSFVTCKSRGTMIPNEFPAQKRAAVKHKVRVTVIDKKCHQDLQKEYLADPESGPCPCCQIGDEWLFERAGGKDDFYHFGRDLDPKFPCAEAWDCISRYIYTGLAGGAFMHAWTNDDRVMIACCNDGTRPVIFKLERTDEAETPDEEAYLAAHNFKCSADEAYTG